MIVKSPDHQVILLDERALFRPDGIALRHALRPVQMIVESRLVGNDQVFMIRRRALQDIQRGHHRGRNPRHPSIWIAGLEGIDRVLHPRNVYMLLNLRDDFRRSWTLALRFTKR